MLSILVSGECQYLKTFDRQTYQSHTRRRYKKWNKDHVLSFIPPDGSFKLLEYQVAKPSENGVARPVGLPLTVKPVIKLEKKGGE